MTGSMADAEDLAQDTFVNAYRQIGTFCGASKFSTWLYRIAINACLNWRQRDRFVWRIPKVQSSFIFHPRRARSFMIAETENCDVRPKALPSSIFPTLKCRR
jgi:RNA polymerase sigma factor (sigma-70 family)